MEKCTEILACLRSDHVGKENAVFSQKLEQRFSLNGRTIRRIVHKLRQEGYPICSNQKGYYYASSQGDVSETVSRLNGLVTGVSNARTGLLTARVLPKELRFTVTISFEDAAG